MPLFLKEEEIAEVVSVSDAIGVLRTAFRQQVTGEATSSPRRRLATGTAFLHMMAGAVPGYFGYKAYATSRTGAGFMFFLFDANTCEQLSIMEADRLGQIRTGAATGIATELLARDDVRVATMFGAGWQAESQLLAMAEVRKLSRVWIVNRNPKRAERFIERMAPQVQAELKPAVSAEDAVRESRLVTTITSSREPVLFGDWIGAGTHVNAVGGNMWLRREVDADLVLGSEQLVVDSIEQARIECGEFLPVLVPGRRHWDEVKELKDIVGQESGRVTPEERTFFKSLGLGLEDVALGAWVYERAKERGMGRKVDM